MKLKLFKKSSKGFTLIELLVVIAIIAILASIILVSLSGARNKAKDSKIQEELSGLRAQMEEYYNSNNFSYGTGTSCTASPFNLPDPGPATLIAGLLSDSSSNSGSMDCNANGNSWAADAPLSTNNTTSVNGGAYWCVDSNGASKSEPGPLAGTSSGTASLYQCQ